MSWVTVIWSMTASACLTLALMNLFIWCRQRDAWANLMFTLVAVGAAAFAGIELGLMRATTPEQYATGVRWIHVPAWMVILSLAAFVRLYLKAGRAWLLWAIIGVRTAALLLNFLLGQNLNYWEITRLQSVSFLGENVSVVGAGISNHWMLLGQFSFVLLLAFVVDATLTAWRQGDRRRAIIVGGSVAFFVFAAAGEATLVLWQLVRWPVIASLPALATIAAMSFELSRDAQRAARLAIDLKESEHRISLAVDAASLRLWEWDIVRNKLWANDQTRQPSGQTPFEPGNFEEFIQSVHPADRESVSHALAKSMDGDGDFECEYRLLLPNQPVRWIISRGLMEFNDHGKPVRMRGVSVDISLRKESELEIIRQRSEVAHLSRVSTLGEISGSLAHELNQPLGIILSNAQAAQRLLMQDPPDLAEVRDILVDIVSEDQRAGDVIKSLRSMLKPGETCLRPLDVNAIVEDVLRLVGGDLIGQNITVERKLAASLPPVLGDPVQLQQVLLNLSLNAFDAMAASPPARRQLTLATMLLDNRVRVSVSDTGCGLPPDVERIFKPFYTTKQKGLGLGLSICRSIVGAHNGRLWAEAHVVAAVPSEGTAASCGATFHVDLPAAPEEKR